MQFRPKCQRTSSRIFAEFLAVHAGNSVGLCSATASSTAASHFGAIWFSAPGDSPPESPVARSVLIPVCVFGGVLAVLVESATVTGWIRPTTPTSIRTRTGELFGARQLESKLFPGGIHDLLYERKRRTLVIISFLVKPGWDFVQPFLTLNTEGDR